MSRKPERSLFRLLPAILGIALMTAPVAGEETLLKAPMPDFTTTTAEVTGADTITTTTDFPDDGFMFVAFDLGDTFIPIENCRTYVVTCAEGVNPRVAGYVGRVNQYGVWNPIYFDASSAAACGKRLLHCIPPDAAHANDDISRAFLPGGTSAGRGPTVTLDLLGEAANLRITPTTFGAGITSLPLSPPTIRSYTIPNNDQNRTITLERFVRAP